MTKTTATKRWMLVNRKTSRISGAYTTRATARLRKTGNQFIYDTVNQVAVR